jgi:hypothetical protein
MSALRKSQIMRIWILFGQEITVESLCRECTSLRVSANSEGSDSKGADREDVVIEEVCNENVKYSENYKRR